VIERDHLAHEHEIRLREERIRTEAVRKPLAPRCARPAQIPDVAAAERRQLLDALRPLRFERLPQRLQGLQVRAKLEAGIVGADADIAVPSERSLEEEGIASLLLVEETEDAERRQQITGKFDGGWSASKACSGKGAA
jgi:hypothetical protein